MQDYILQMYTAYKEFKVLPSQFKKELAHDMRMMHQLENALKHQSVRLQNLESMKQQMGNQLRR